jgi:hypothetical protein
MSIWDEIEDDLEAVEELLYGECEDDEDYWLGETDLTKVIR